MSTADGLVTAGKIVLTDQFRNDDLNARFRVSNAVCIFDVDHIAVDRWENLIDVNENAGGDYTRNDDGSYGVLTTSNTGDRVVEQSYEYVTYQAGQTKTIYISGCLNPLAASSTGMLSRMGCYDDDADKTTGADQTYADGHFVQLAEGVVSMVERSSSTGTVVNTVVNQSSWNVDVLDGTGESGFTLDSTKALQLVIQLVWPVGTVRMGFMIDDIFVVAHKFFHDTAIPYMRTAVLPIRWELDNVSAGTLTFTQNTMAASVQMEDGYIPRGMRYHTGFTTTTKTISTTMIPVLSFRLTSTGRRRKVYFRRLSFMVTTGDDVKWAMIWKPASITGATWVTANGSTDLRYDFGATAYTGGIEVSGGYAIASSTIDIPFEDIYTNLPFTGARNGGNEEIVFAATNAISGGSASVAMSVDWVEII